MVCYFYFIYAFNLVLKYIYRLKDGYICRDCYHISVYLVTTAVGVQSSKIETFELENRFN